jgi:VIT1/CCC1 family predicted Fe2+/Mn2+ transporter
MKNLKESVKVGLTFGLTSGVITTLGLMVGLNSGTNLKLAVIAGILTIAVADAFSDALGIHVSQESTNNNSSKEVWTATFATFIFKFIFALTFIVPVLIFSLHTAVIVSIIWGLLLLAVASYFIAKETNQKPLHVIFEHVLISVIVVIIANYLGVLINKIVLN